MRPFVGGARRRGGTAGGGGSFTPNLPAGLSLYADATLGDFPSNYTYTAQNLAFGGDAQVADNASIPTAGTVVNWHTVTVNSGLWRNATDNAAPYGPSVTDTVYVEGGAGNGSCDTYFYSPAGQNWVKAYFAMSLRVSPNYVWHSNVEKFFYPIIETSGFADRVTGVEWQPNGTGEGPNADTCGWVVDAQLGGLGEPVGSWYVQQSTGNTARMRKDRYQTVEMFVQMHTPGNANGIVRVWVDGVLALESTTFRFAPSTYTAQSTIRQVRFTGTRGGGASSVNVPTGGMYRRYDRLAFYGSTSF